MKHWAAEYVGSPWTPETDCLYWFRFWSWVHFGREVLGGLVNHEHMLRSASKMMAGDIRKDFGYVKQDGPPLEGDAVFLSQRSRPHHVGMVVYPGGKFGVLHALEGAGVILSDQQDLSLNGWSIRSFWTYAG